MMPKTVWLRFISLAVLASLVWSYPSGLKQKRSQAIDDLSHAQDGGEFGAKIAPMDYQFAYEVRDDKTTNFQNRVEFSENGFLQGSYSHLAPDGVVRTVIYSDDGTTGYQVVMHEVPTNISVIGSGLPSDPLLRGKDYTPTRSEDFHSLLNLINSSGKFGDRTVTKFGFPASSIEFPTFRTKSSSSSEDSESSRSEEQSLESSGADSSSFDTSSMSFGPAQNFDSKFKTNADSELSSKSSFDHERGQENLSPDEVTSFKSSIPLRTYDKAISNDVESAVFINNNLLLKQTKGDAGSEAIASGNVGKETTDGGGIPIVVLDQTFFNSLEAQGAMSTKLLVEAIQQAMQAAISSHPENQINQVDSTSDVHLNKKPLLKEVKSQQIDSSSKISPPTPALDGGIPVIVLDQKIFESLDKPGSAITKHQFASGIQQALQAALGSTTSTVKQSEENAAYNKHSDQDITPSKQVEEIFSVSQQTEDVASKEQSVEALVVNKQSEENEIHLESEQTNREPSKNEISGSDEITATNSYENKIDVGKSASVSQEGGIPIIALDKLLFDSLDAPGSKMNRHQLVQAIQQALEIATTSGTQAAESIAQESSQNIDPSSFNAGLTKEITSHPIAGTSTNSGFESSTTDKVTPVIAIKQTLFESLDAPGSTMTRQQLVQAIQDALHTAMGHPTINEEKTTKFIATDLTGTDPAKGETSGTPESNGKSTNDIKESYSIIYEDNEGGEDQEVTRLSGQTLVDSLGSMGLAEQQKLREAIQQTMQAAIESTAANVVEQDGDSLEDEGNFVVHDNVITQSTNPVTSSGGGTPVIAFDQAFFESLDEPGSSMNRQQLVFAVQDALNAALESSPSNVAEDADANSLEEKNNSKKDEEKLSSESTKKDSSKSEEAATKSKDSDDDDQENNSERGGIPIVAINQSLFESLDAPGSGMTRQQLIQAIQQAMDAALKSSPSVGQSSQPVSKSSPPVSKSSPPVSKSSPPLGKSLIGVDRTVERKPFVNKFSQISNSENDSETGAAQNNDSGEKPTKIIFDIPVRTGFKTFTNNMAGFRKIHNKMATT